MNFNTRLVDLRIEKGLSQKEAAHDLGISQALLSHYEKGIREYSLSFLCKIADYYNVTTDYILGKSESRTGLQTQTLQDSDEDLIFNTRSI